MDLILKYIMTPKKKVIFFLNYYYYKDQTLRQENERNFCLHSLEVYSSSFWRLFTECYLHLKIRFPVFCRSLCTPRTYSAARSRTVLRKASILVESINLRLKWNWSQKPQCNLLRVAVKRVAKDCNSPVRCQCNYTSDGRLSRKSIPLPSPCRCWMTEDLLMWWMQPGKSSDTKCFDGWIYKVTINNDTQNDK